MNNKIISKEKIEQLAPKVVLDDDVDPVRINVHPTLEDEFKFWKPVLEKIGGYELTGGKPTVSKLCAHILKQLRTKSAREEKKIVIEIHKVIGLKKVKIMFL